MSSDHAGGGASSERYFICGCDCRYVRLRFRDMREGWGYSYRGSRLGQADYLLYTGVLVLSCFMWSGALDRQLWYSSIIFYSITSIAYNQPPYWYLICPLLNKSYQIYLPMYVRTYSKSRQTNSSNRTSWSHAARGRWTKHGSIDVSYK